MVFLVLLAIGAIIGAIFFRLAERKNRKGLIWGGLTFGSLTAFLFILMAIPSMTLTPTTKIIALVGGYGSLALFIISAITLAFLPFLCPECKKKLTRKQWRKKECPQCRKFEKELSSRMET